MLNQVWTSTDRGPSPRHVTAQVRQAKLDSPIDVSVSTDEPPLGFSLERAPLDAEHRSRVREANGPVWLLWLLRLADRSPAVEAGCDVRFKVHVQTLDRSAIFDRHTTWQSLYERGVRQDGGQ